jgi:hypothetical protein
LSVDSVSNKRLADFISTLQNLPSQGQDQDEEETYLEYTTRWIKIKNKGGLFVIPDVVYQCFTAIEEVTRAYLTEIDFSNNINFEKLHRKICKDDNVQFWWALVTATIDDDLASILLSKITKLWITVRGFSYANAIVEQYKQCNTATL